MTVTFFDWELQIKYQEEESSKQQQIELLLSQVLMYDTRKVSMYRNQIIMKQQKYVWYL